MEHMIDWKLAGTVANGVAGLQSAGDPAPFEHPESFAAESERLVGAYTGLTAAELPRAEAVGRDGWIDANLGSMRNVLDPVVERIDGGSKAGSAALMSGAAGGLLALEAGAITGFLAGRVLGQLEFPVLDPDGPARLLFVAPNLGQAARQLEAEPDVLLRWVALHETTHALQFGGVPWLRPHLAELVSELLEGLQVDPRSLLRLPDPRDLRSLLDKVREDGIAALALGPERRAVLDRLQSLMAVLEGYAEHVMDAVGVQVIPDLDAPARGAPAPPARPLRACCGCSSASSAWTSSCASTSRARRSATASSSARGSPRSTASGRARRACRRPPSSTIPGAWLAAQRRPAAPPAGRRLAVLRNEPAPRVYKHMFAGTLLSELELSSLCWGQQREADDDGRDHQHHDFQQRQHRHGAAAAAAAPKRAGTTRRRTTTRARKAPAKTTARRARTTAKRETATAAQANTAPRRRPPARAPSAPSATRCRRRRRARGA